jgi:hypothetical protein
VEDSVTKLNKFVENQFYENCFGIETFKQMDLTNEVAESFCSNSNPEAQNIPPGPLSPEFQPLRILHPWPGYPASTFPLGDWTSRQAREERVQQDSLHRYKRSLNTKLDELKMKMTTKMKKISCILHQSGLTDADGNIATDGMMENVDSMQVEQSLKSDLKQSIKQCSQVVKCLTLNMARRDTEGAIEFIKCFEKKKKEACVKKSIREKLVLQLREDMSLEDVKNILSGVSAKSPVYYNASPLLHNIVDHIFITEFL